MIRWLCKRCGEKWIHPVEVCINCNSKVDREVGSIFTIAGFTKVHVPSTLHPSVPYSVVLLKDNHGNLMPKKTMKEFGEEDIDKEFVFGRGDVAVVKVKDDMKSAVEFALKQIGADTSKKAKINYELSDEKRETIFTLSQKQLVAAITEVFIEVEEIKINVPLLKIGEESDLRGFTIGNAILAPKGDEPTHLGMIIVGEGEKVKKVFDKITTGKGEIDFDVGGDEIEANVRCS